MDIETWKYREVRRLFTDVVNGCIGGLNSETDAKEVAGILRVLADELDPSKSPATSKANAYVDLVKELIHYNPRGE